MDFKFSLKADMVQHVFWICLFLPLTLQVETKVEEKTSSQCFRKQGMPYVSLYCGAERIIRIKKAIHGVHKESATDCKFLEGDCQSDQMSNYDWAKCNGRHTCVQMMKWVQIPRCNEDQASTPTSDGVQGYLSVTYDCVPGQEAPPTTKGAPVVPSTTHKAKTSVAPKYTHKAGPKHLDLCQIRDIRSSYLQIASPGFPGALPGGTDCICQASSPAGSHMTLILQDISLGLHQGACTDWLAVDPLGSRGNRLVACGQMESAGKIVQSQKNTLTFRFHTAAGSHPSIHKGFRVALRTSGNSHANLQIKCQKLSSKKANEKGSPKSLPPTNLHQLPNDRGHSLPPSSQSSGGSAFFISWIVGVFIAIHLLYKATS